MTAQNRSQQDFVRLQDQWNRNKNTKIDQNRKKVE